MKGLLLLLFAASLSSGMIDHYHHHSRRRSIPDPFDDSLTWTNSVDKELRLEPRCVLQASNKSVGHFRHVVYYGQLNFVYMHLTTIGDVNITGSKYTIGPDVWTWTFYGDEGALEFLNWPPEFGIWSMGLLNNYVFDLQVELERVSGNCTNLTLGNIEDNTAISKALVQLVTAIMNVSLADSEKYGPSFFCYKERIYITPFSLYMLCRHITCPVKAMQYSCCQYFYNQSLGRREIDCDRPSNFEYDHLWFIGPILVSLVLFAYLPLPLLNLSAWCSTHISKQTHTYQIEYFDSEQDTAFVFYDGTSQITLFNTLFAPFMQNISCCGPKVSRIVRFILPFLSVSVIGIQVLVDHEHLRQFVLKSIKSGMPMGFRSMLAGYQREKANFLPFLGGPFVALALYLGITCFFIVLPRSFSNHLVSGIPNCKNTRLWSPVLLNIKDKERLGSEAIQQESGYKRIYNLCLAQFFMLLNKSYWLLAIEVQIKRWKVLKTSKSCLIFFPFYFICCIIEHIFCLLLYGFPMLFLGVLILNSYYKCIIRIRYSKVLGNLSTMVLSLLMILLTVCVTLFLFMMCTIFLDACLLLSRLFIFTYTGIVVYPKISYGYLIFILTTVYYIWDCVTSFSLTYMDILKTTIKVCRKMQRANDTYPLVIKVGLFLGVRSTILEHVIERIRPRRKQAFLSLLKLVIILGAIWVSIELLLKTDKFRELHILVHVSTALFTCAVPKIARSMFGKVEDKFARKIAETDIKNAVRNMIRQNSSHCTINTISDSD